MSANKCEEEDIVVVGQPSLRVTNAGKVVVEVEGQAQTSQNSQQQRQQAELEDELEEQLEEQLEELNTKMSFMQKCVLTLVVVILALGAAYLVAYYFFGFSF